jgi:hypothetical protein
MRTFSRTGILDHVAGPSADGQNRRDDRLDHPADAAREAGILGHHRRRRRDRAAAFMAEHDDQRHAELGDGIFDTSHRLRRCRGVAGIADDEELAQAPAEQLLGADAAVRAADQHRERRLALGDLQPPRPAHRAGSWPIRDEAAIAFLECGERLAGGEAGALGGRGGSRRFGASAAAAPTAAAPPINVRLLISTAVS